MGQSLRFHRVPQLHPIVPPLCQVVLKEWLATFRQPWVTATLCRWSPIWGRQHLGYNDCTVCPLRPHRGAARVRHGLVPCARRLAVCAVLLYDRGDWGAPHARTG